MKIIWSPLAVEKLSDYAAIIAQDKPMVAERWIDEIFNSVTHLANLPNSGKMVPEIRRKDIREIYNGNYRIIYKILESEIQILTVRHRRQLLNQDDLES